jgi:hypothetical protein
MCADRSIFKHCAECTPLAWITHERCRVARNPPVPQLVAARVSTRFAGSRLALSTSATRRSRRSPSGDLFAGRGMAGEQVRPGRTRPALPTARGAPWPPAPLWTPILAVSDPSVESAPSVVNPGFRSGDNTGESTTDDSEGTDDTRRHDLRFPLHPHVPAGRPSSSLPNRHECHAPWAARAPLAMWHTPADWREHLEGK